MSVITASNDIDQNHSGPLTFYASIGPELIRFTLSGDGSRLKRGPAFVLPDNVQYVWPHASGNMLYAATSNGAPGGGPRGDRHHLVALAIAPDTGSLALEGVPIALTERPIHIATDTPSAFILAAFNNPSATCVYRIDRDGRLGSEVPQDPPLNVGDFAHHVRISPDNRKAFVLARGSDHKGDTPEQPGRLTLYNFDHGKLTSPLVVAPNEGFGFGPRDLEFHPIQPWFYLSLERENEIAFFSWSCGNQGPVLRARRSTLSKSKTGNWRQAAGPLRVHPNGRVAYVTNRANTALSESNTLVCGENSIAVFDLNAVSGEPSLVQVANSGGIEPRSIHVSPSGRLLIVAHVMNMTEKTEDGSRDMAPGFSIFTIAENGHLAPTATHDLDTKGRLLWWMGMVTEARD